MLKKPPSFWEESLLSLQPKLNPKSACEASGPLSMTNGDWDTEGDASPNGEKLSSGAVSSGTPKIPATSVGLFA
ncbi:hypothetical protein L596_014183 [Steinernema carpocapsae]|uniref:Uncharacterized protein n=1 Tax=Steinernema carpocapsae TaxID=34508 RepID=A0A4U5NB11_STECR|nr:hypothetical protein L596_014183 [Steinernema carpocapsae]